MRRSWIPVRRDWRLNERHYGDLTGRNKAETKERYGEAQLNAWRRSYDVPPPPITPENEFNPNDDERYAQVPRDQLPLAECLTDVRSEEHTSELQSLMRNSYAVFCLKKKNEQ